MKQTVFLIFILLMHSTKNIALPKKYIFLIIFFFRDSYEIKYAPLFLTIMFNNLNQTFELLHHKAQFISILIISILFGQVLVRSD